MSVVKTSAARPYYEASLLRDFVLGAIASVGACTFTNPMEVVKTRLQLQGELAHTAQRPFRGVFDAFRKISRYEGVLALQKGLVPGYLFQIAMNGTRLGSFSLTRRLFNVRRPEETSYFFGRNVAAGALAGVIAACVGSPFYLVKTRLQTQTGNSKTMVGLTQYNYKGTWDALTQIYRNEGGIRRGLFRGVEAIALRVAVGSATQLSTYEQSRMLVLRSGLLDEQSSLLALSFAASSISGFFVVLLMNPFDLVCSRLYNQKVQDGRGNFYRGPFDCLVKTVRAEGFLALYKGLVAHYARMAPHTVLTFVFLERLRVWWDRYDLG